jgi:hypothetical protein
LDILICQTCGAILRGKNSTCSSCGTIVSNYSPTALPVMSHGSTSLMVRVDPDPLLLDRVVARRQVSAVLERPQSFDGDGNGNGHGNGHGNGNGHGAPEPSEIDFAPAPDLIKPSPPPDAVASTPAAEPPYSASPAQALSPSVSPSSAAMGASVPVWASAAGAVAGVAGGAISAHSAGPVPIVSEAPSVTPSPSGPGTDASAFFAQAAVAPQPVEAPKPSLPPNPAAPAEFFSAQPSGSTEEPEAQAPPAPPAGSQDYELSDRADFFASPAKPKSEETAEPAPAAEAQTQAQAEAPPVTGEAPIKVEADAAPPPVADAVESPAAKAREAEEEDDSAPPAQPKKAAERPAKPSPESLDFFAASKFTPSSKSGSESEKSESKKKNSSSGLFSDAPATKPKRRPAQDDDDDVPRVAAPLGYKGKDSSAKSKAGDDDELDEEERPKIKPKRSKVKEEKAKQADEDEDEEENNDHDEDDEPKKPVRKKVAVKKNDDDEDADVDSEDSDEEPPPRRNFSSSGGSKLAARKKSKDSDDEDEDGDDSDKPAKPGLLGVLEKEVSFLGMSMTRMNQVILCGILGFVVVVVISMGATVISNFGGLNVSGLASMGQPAVELPPLTGEWSTDVVFEEGGKADETLGKMEIRQSGSKILGSGNDKLNRRFASFQINGDVRNGNMITFAKAYMLRDDSTGEIVPDKPIQFDGKIVYAPGEPMRIRGVWIKKRSVGKFLHHRIKAYTGQWSAEMINGPPAPTTNTGTGTAQNAPPVDVASNNGPAAPPPAYPWDGLSMDQKFLLVAVLIGLLVIGMIGGSLALFGPGGKMNIWEKQKYIPTQFRAQHKKMRGELAKPLKAGGLPLGQRYEWSPYKFWEWGAKDLAMPASIRKRDPHMLVLGAGDKGKTRLIANMITHDIDAGDRAVVVIDSDGDLVEMVTRWIAAHPKGKELAKRVVLLDPTYRGGSLGYNPLEMPEDEDLQSAASSVVYGFKAIYTEPPGSQSQWNAQTANILRNCALLLIANGKTLTDLPTLLNDNDFRDVMLEAIEKEKDDRAEYITLLDTWGQYKRLARTDQWITWVEPILNRVSPMLGDSRIRNILTKPVSDIRMRQLVEQKKILLVKVAKGQLDQNANLLGSLLVTGVKQAALSLANEGSPKQNPVALYLDEFDNFIEKETIEAICSETDKFRIGFVGVIKTLQHLPEDFRNQIVINVGTCAVFALAKKDGDVLGPQMFRVDGRKIKHQTIQNFFNKVNTSPQFELISDEEKLNIDRVVGQEARTFYCYRVGTVAGVFHMRAHDFPDIEDRKINAKLIEKMRGVKADKKRPAPKDDVKERME